MTLPELRPAHSEEALHTSCYHVTFQVEIQVLPTGYFVPGPYCLSEESPTTCHLFNTISSPFYSEGTEAQRGKVTLLESHSRHVGHQTWAIQLLSPSAAPWAASLTKQLSMKSRHHFQGGNGRQEGSTVTLTDVPRWRGPWHSADAPAAVLSQGLLTLCGSRSSETPVRALQCSSQTRTWGQHTRPHKTHRWWKGHRIPNPNVPRSPPPS